MKRTRYSHRSARPGLTNAPAQAASQKQLNLTDLMEDLGPYAQSQWLVWVARQEGYADMGDPPS